MGPRRPEILPIRLMRSYQIVALLSGVFLLTGNLLLYRNMRHVFIDDVLMRSRALVQQHLHVVAYSLRNNDSMLLTQLSDFLLTQPGVRYVVITDVEHRSLFSKSVFSRSEFILPEEFRRAACSNIDISVNEGHLFGENIARIDVDIRPDLSLSDCVGTLYIGISLKNAIRPLWNILAITLGSSTLLIGGILVGIAVFSSQTRYMLERIYHSLLEMIPESLRQHPSDVSREQRELPVENAVNQLKTYLDQLQNHLHTMSAQIQGAASELVNTAEAQMENNHRHANLALQYSQATSGFQNALLAQTSNAQQIHETTASMLHSMRSIDSNIERLATGIEEMRESVENNMERVKTLNDMIRNIRNAVKTIASIADLTKLIAFNASIEAAGAGKSGGRFSIVATEVRRLANTVVNSVEEIGALVSSVETAAADLQLSSETEHHKVLDAHTCMFELRELLQQTEHAQQETSACAQTLVSSMQNSVDVREQLNTDIQKLTDEAEQFVHHHLHLLEAIKRLLALTAHCEAEIPGSTSF